MRRVFRRVLVGLIVLVVVFAAATARLIIWPASGMPARVDAIVMLAGPGDDRLPAALALAREHRAPVLVVSTGWEGYGGPCPAPVSGVRLICFEPNPGNTRGETEYVASLARRNHWHSIVLVTITPQDTRARMLMRRCYDGSVYVMTAGIPLSSYPYQIAYEWGALFKAEFLQRSC
jgi:uncharacterized SAM-binding protein YcdF (DUF218 family)